MNVYTIWDVKANSCQAALYLFPNDEIAKRAFSSVLRNPTPDFKLLCEYPDDFYLVNLGEFKQEGDGELVPLDGEEAYGNGDGRVCSLGDLAYKG